jgi:hypothetical protein
MTMAWWKTAKAGTKLVCIAEGGWLYPSPDDPPPPVKGRVYILEHVCPDDWEDTGFHIHLCEYDGNYTFDPRGFKPAQPKSTETGMKILRKILKGQRAPEGVS